MFWRDDPRAVNQNNKDTAETGNEKPEWPRNGALLQGKIHILPEAVDGNKKWLEVFEYQQAGQKKWQQTPGCWMIFFQEGDVLHRHRT